MISYEVIAGDYITDEGITYKGYGIVAMDAGEIIDTYEDLYFERDKANKLVEQLKQRNVGLDELRDVVCCAIEIEYDVKRCDPVLP